MLKFLIGCVIGAMLTLTAYVLFPIDPRLQIEVGRLLDRDTLYLNNGHIIEGWIVRENEQDLLVELETGNFSIRRSECNMIRKNTFLRYLRQLI